MGSSSSIASVWSPVDESKGKLICLFCNGSSCRHENYTNQVEKNGIHGLHSSWITSEILAMQRPSSRIIKEQEIIKQFGDTNIGAIINCQEAGEHPICGDGITSSGFSYLPEEFMNNNIFYYNFGWLDMTKPTNNLMMRIVQVMSFTLNIAVHCHAGLGRTGLTIACFLIYEFHYSTRQAVDLVRKQRPGSIQTSEQYIFCQDFEDWMNKLKTVYVLPPSTNDDLFTLQEHINRQSIILHGQDSKKYQNVPKIVQILCYRLRKHKLDAAKGFIYVNWSLNEENNLTNIKMRLNRHDFHALETTTAFQCQLLLDWFDSLSVPFLSIDFIDSCLKLNSEPVSDRSKASANLMYLYFSKELSLVAFSTLDLVLTLICLLRPEMNEQLFIRVLNRFAISLTHCDAVARECLSPLHPVYSIPAFGEVKSGKYDNSNVRSFLSKESDSRKIFDFNLSKHNFKFSTSEVCNRVTKFLLLLLPEWNNIRFVYENHHNEKVGRMATVPLFTHHDEEMFDIITRRHSNFRDPHFQYALTPAPLKVPRISSSIENEIFQSTLSLNLSSSDDGHKNIPNSAKSSAHKPKRLILPDSTDEFSKFAVPSLPLSRKVSIDNDDDLNRIIPSSAKSSAHKFISNSRLGFLDDDNQTVKFGSPIPQKLPRSFSSDKDDENIKLKQIIQLYAGLSESAKEI